MCFWCHQLSVWFASAAPWLSEESANGVAYIGNPATRSGCPRLSRARSDGAVCAFYGPLYSSGASPPHVHVSECRASQRSEGNVRVLRLPRWFPWFCSGVTVPSLPAGALARCTGPSLWRREPSADWWVTLQQDLHPVRPQVRLRSSVGGSQASSQRRSQSSLTVCLRRPRSQVA